MFGVRTIGTIKAFEDTRKQMAQLYDELCQERSRALTGGADGGHYLRDLYRPATMR